MQNQDLNRKKHCDHCHLSFGLREKREAFGDLVVHKEPCLTTLQHRATLRVERFTHQGERHGQSLYPLS